MHRQTGVDCNQVTIIIHDLCTFPETSNILVHLVMKCLVYRETVKT